MNKFLQSTFFLYFLAALIGVAGFLRSYPPDFITGNEGFYSGDPAQSTSGYYAYRDSPWRLPILWTNRLNYPDGLSIGNTDSLPIAALLLKPFKSILPPDFHYFGLWILIAYILQAIGAVFLIRQMGRVCWWHGLLAACFALLVPAFIAHQLHTALSTHGVVLVGLGFYFQAIKNYRGIKPPTSWYVKWVLLIGMSILVHPYLTAMTVPIYVAALMSMLPVRKSLRILLISLFIPIITLVVLFWFFWYMPGQPVGKPIPGYGVYSMNLLSPFIGGHLIWKDSLLWVPSTQRGDGLYLGLGVMGIILMAMWLQRANLKPTFLKHRFLVVLLVAITIYALSNEVYVARLLILKYPDWLTAIIRPFADNFRASGRFFWPVGYTILFSSLCGIFLSEKKWVIWFIIAMLLIQYADMPSLPYRNFLSSDAAMETNYPRRVWEKLLAGKRELYIMPAWGCGGGWEIPTLQVLAAKNHVLVNTAYAARQSPNCRRKMNDDRTDIKEGTVHLYTSPITRKQVENWMDEQAEKWCRRNTIGILCVPYPGESDLEILDSDNFLPFFSRNIKSFIANKLSGDIGKPEYASRTARMQVDQPGYLIRGPGIQLLAGTYFFQLKYHSTQPAQSNIGWVEVYLEEYILGANQGILKQFLLAGSNNQESKLASSFILPDNLQHESLEIRVYWNGTGDLAVDQIIIYQLDAEIAGG